MKREKAILVNLSIVMTCIPISGLVAWLALRAGIGPRYGDESTAEMVAHHVFAPVSSGIMTCDTVQTSILAVPPIVFLVAAAYAVYKKKEMTSYIFSALVSTCWVLIVMLAVYAGALP